MWIKRKMAQQFAKPTGSLGILAGWLMARSNKELAAWTVKKLAVQMGERVLEVGFGPGRAIELLAEQSQAGLIAGVDHSELMFRVASRRNRKHCRAGKIRLHYGSAGDLDYPFFSFDVIYGNNVHFFWKDPVQELSNLRLLLQQEGRLLLVFQPRWVKSFRQARELALDLADLFERAGFSKVKFELRESRPLPMIAVSGYNRVAANSIYPGITQPAIKKLKKQEYCNPV